MNSPAKFLLMVLMSTALMTCGPSETQVRSWNAAAKSRLHDLYLSCSAVWAIHGPDQDCNPDMANNPKYGFVPNPEVEISGSGNKKSFNATASHAQSEDVFTINSNGMISP